MLCFVMFTLSSNYRAIRHETWSHIKGVITLHHHRGLLPVMRTVRPGFPPCAAAHVLTHRIPVDPQLISPLKINPAVLCASVLHPGGGGGQDSHMGPQDQSDNPPKENHVSSTQKHPCIDHINPRTWTGLRVLSRGDVLHACEAIRLTK